MSTIKTNRNFHIVNFLSFLDCFLDKFRWPPIRWKKHRTDKTNL